MKTLVAVLASIVLASWAWAEAPIAVTVSTTSVVVLPSREVDTAQAWEDGLVLAQGALVQHQGRMYLAVAAQTSTNAPTHTSGEARSLRYVTKRPRATMSVQNRSGSTVYLAFGGAAAEVNKGLMLVAGAFVSLDDVQGPVSAVSEGTSYLIATEVLR